MAQPQLRRDSPRTMASLDVKHRHGAGSPRTPSSPTVGQLLRANEVRERLPQISPTYSNDHEMENDHSSTPKKSVLAKVKERARKWRSNLSKKKHGDNGSATSLSVVAKADDEEEENPEYLGAPMYESEMAPEVCKENARQHPRAVPVIPENHILPSGDVHTDTEQKSSKTLTETVAEKLAPAYETVSDATHAIASKIQSLTVSTSETPAQAGLDPTAVTAASSIADPAAIAPEHVAQAYTPAQVAEEPGDHVRGGGQKWDKGVSVKEYIMHKFEPGEDERALSQVISEAISPKKAASDGSMVNKVKEAVNSFLWAEESSQPTTDYHSAKNSPSNIPISTNAHEVTEEESHGRILQAN